MNENIDGYFTKAGEKTGGRMAAGSASGETTGGRMAAGSAPCFPPAGGLTGGRMAASLPQSRETDAFSDVLPGTGNPTVQELAQWKDGTLTRYPCCRRVQPCGLIYCLFCHSKLAIQWEKTMLPTEAELPSLSATGDVHDEAKRLVFVMRSMHWGMARGRSTKGVLARGVGEVLKWRARWLNTSFEQVLR